MAVKLYIIQKRVFASSLEEARKMDKTRKPDEIFLDMDWLKGSEIYTNTKKIGFK